MNNENAMMVFIGAIIAIIGTFLPLAEFMTSTISYYGIGGAEKYIFLLSLLSAPALMFAGKDKFVIFSLLTAWLSLLYPVIKGLIDSNDSGLLDKVASKLEGAASDMAGNILMDVANYHWGGYIFLVGILVFTVGCIRVWRA